MAVFVKGGWDTTKCSCWALTAGEPQSCHLECPNADGFWQIHVHAMLGIKLCLLLDRPLQSAPETFPTQGGVLFKISQRQEQHHGKAPGFWQQPHPPQSGWTWCSALGYMITFLSSPFFRPGAVVKLRRQTSAGHSW